MGERFLPPKKHCFELVVWEIPRDVMCHIQYRGRPPSDGTTPEMQRIKILTYNRRPGTQSYCFSRSAPPAHVVPRCSVFVVGAGREQ